MEISVEQSQQEKLQVIAEKKRRQAEVENKRRELEDERRQLQHLKSKALRERWLLDGAPSAGSEEDEAQKQLQEDEAKTQNLEETILRLEQELEELETGVSATSTKENLAEISMKPIDGPVDSLDTTPATVVTVVHEVRGTDSSLENGVRLLSSSEVEELIHKADAVDAGGTPEKTAVAEKTVDIPEKVGVAGKAQAADAACVSGEGETPPGAEEGTATPPAEAAKTPKKEITGLEAKPTAGVPPTETAGATAENPVSMVFMGYQNVEDEAETKKMLGLEGTVKAEVVLIEDQANGKEEQAPSNGSTAEVKGQEVEGEKAESDPVAAELNTKEKRPCKCCSIM
ncbi:hypothetical protein AGOR_G00242360 [Albula goreensis]|uniref:Paralemmin-1 n=1 Tax=Albula goreensis TaxID=1534307 RepID=A0A8T3CH22_9TELE|nr:hypothetical protein AGOR_G00242360 [Albula goreensis]